MRTIEEQNARSRTNRLVTTYFGERVDHAKHAVACIQRGWAHIAHTAARDEHQRRNDELEMRVEQLGLFLVPLQL